MKLLFLKQDALDTLKENISANIPKYQSINNEWVLDSYDGENPFLEFKLEFKEFKLNTNFETASEMDLANSKILYENLKGLSDTQAADERLWSGLTHSNFYEYVHKRWVFDEKNMEKPNYILSRYFYSGGQARGIIRNTLSKLWWIGRLTYDETRCNPFELTDVLGNSDMATRVSDMFTSSFSRNPKVVHAFLGAIKAYEDEGCRIGGYTYRQAVQYMNAFGGMTLVDYLDESEMKNTIMKKMAKIMKESKNTDTGVKIFFQNKNNKIDADNIYTSIRKIAIGDTFTTIGIEGEKKNFIVPKQTDGELSIVQKNFIGKSIGDEIEVKGKKYTIINIGE